MKFKLVETVELSERGPSGQGGVWKGDMGKRNPTLDLNNYCLHHLNSIHNDNSERNRAVIPNKLHTDITREINKRCREYLVKHNILQSISRKVWEDFVDESDFYYDEDKKIFFPLDQIITKYSIPEDNQLNLFGEM